MRAAKHFPKPTQAAPAPVIHVDQTVAPRDYRRELWIGVAIACVGASNCTSTGSAARFADAALEAYDKRFGGA